MNDSKEVENKGNQQLRMKCIDSATRVVGKPEYLLIKGEWEKQQGDVVEVAGKIYEFITK